METTELKAQYCEVCGAFMGNMTDEAYRQSEHRCELCDWDINYDDVS